MAFHIRDEATDRVVRQLAKRWGMGLTDAVRRAVQNELEREVCRVPLAERIGRLRAQIGGSAGSSPTPAAADPWGGAKSPLIYVTGGAMSEILSEGAGADHLCDEIEQASKAFTSQHAVYHAARLLVDRRGLSADDAAHGAESFVQLAQIKMLPLTDKVFAAALEGRKRWWGAGNNQAPDEDVLLDAAMCAQFRVPLRMLEAPAAPR